MNNQRKYVRHCIGFMLSLLSTASRIIRMTYWRARLGDLGSHTYIYPRAVIYTPSNVHIGSHVSINDFVHIRGRGRVDIGDDVLIAPHVIITSEGHEVNALAVGVKYRDTTNAYPVYIGRNVWVGAAAVILPGVTIGEGAVVAAGALVTKDVGACTLVAGVPARFVRKLCN